MNILEWLFRNPTKPYIGWRILARKGFQAPFPVDQHVGLGDGPDFADHIRFGELESGDSGRVQAPTHLTYFMITVLLNLTRGECAHNIIRCGLLILLEPLDILHNPVCLFMGILGVVQPVGPGRITQNICREVDQILLVGILDREKGPPPLPARL
jgi:hypothetical protein